MLAFPAACGADITRFDLSGIVTDGTGGVLPGVTVSLKNADTGFNRSTVTDSEGATRSTRCRRPASGR